MKDTTRTFYEAAVVRAAGTIAASLDSALDLTALARDAALSPLHFHRIFRGLVGETPLALHRRLRLERAALQLAHTDVPVTTIAFDAGYETHESFTRAFREAYAASPSELRTRVTSARAAGERIPQLRLAARCGVHVTTASAVTTLSLLQEHAQMHVTIESMPAFRVASVAHRGPYAAIGQAFAQIHAIAAPAGLLAHARAMVALYHDDPEVTPPAELRADAGLVVPEALPLPTGLTELVLPAGTYARTLHEGPYDRLGDTWSRFMGAWLPQSGRRIGRGPTYERYLNTPGDVAPDALRTELYLSLV